MDRARSEQIATLRPQCLPGSIGADRVGKEKVGRCFGVPSRDARPVPAHRVSAGTAAKLISRLEIQR